MSDDTKRDEALKRYAAATHAMQSGVAMMMNYDPAGTDPKHLRVGVNSALVSVSALAKLLIDKGIITDLEWATACADMMGDEVSRYEDEIAVHLSLDPVQKINLR